MMTLGQIGAQTRAALPPERAGVPWLAGGMRGSHAHGTYISPEHEHGTDDVDVFVVAVPNRDAYVTLTDGPRDVFETAGEDLDILWYDARKFFRLLWQQNPNVHQWLWTPADAMFFSTPMWERLVARRQDFISDKMFSGLLGYAHGQLQLMRRGGTKSRYMGAKREALMHRYGYDIKNAAHCIRLLFLAKHLGESGTLDPKLPDSELGVVVRIKSGGMLLADVVGLCDFLFEQAATARRSAALPEDIHVSVFANEWRLAMRELGLREAP